MTAPEWVPVCAAATHYCVDRRTISRWIKAGLVRYRYAPSGRVRVYIGDVESPTCRKRLERRKRMMAAPP